MADATIMGISESNLFLPLQLIVIFVNLVDRLSAKPRVVKVSRPRSMTNQVNISYKSCINDSIRNNTLVSSFLEDRWCTSE